MLQAGHVAQLLASKTAVGHAEPASGLVGFAAATAFLQLQRATPLLHMQTVNPHVADALDGMGRGHGMARGAGPAVMPKQGSTAVGISAFAFQVRLSGSHILEG